MMKPPQVRVFFIFFMQTPCDVESYPTSINIPNYIDGNSKKSTTKYYIKWCYAKTYRISYPT